MDIDTLAELEKKLLYEFNNKSFLENSLRHSSFVNEQNNSRLQDNERLEFLGDAVVNLVIGHILIEHYPELNEGDLSKIRAHLVSENQLSEIARLIDLGEFVILGKGEIQTKGMEKKSILADCFEAVIAAVYLDGGFDKTFQVLQSHFSPFLESYDNQDSKSQLQEYVQMHYKKTPLYKVIEEKGPDHDKTFNIMLNVNGLETKGTGKSKKKAEQDAAKKALLVLKNDF